MITTELTKAQLVFATAGESAYAEACPGAGKTRAIVERFLGQAQKQPRKGVALLSFTNVAVDEVGARCAHAPQLLGTPHFVGTFDSFINTFVVGPEWTAWKGRVPIFIDSWDSQDSANFSIAGTKPYLVFSLEWFDISIEDKKAILRRDSVRGNYASALLQVYDSNQERVNSRAWDKWEWKVFDRSYISCSASRAFMRMALSKRKARARIGKLLASRFVEIIVDEAQDCGAEELELLSFMADLGIRVAMVGDPDQSIFEFRDAQPAEVRKLGERLGQTPRMAENFRSSPAVCDIVRSLRDGKTGDIPSGPNKDSTVPIILLPFNSISEVADGVRPVSHSLGVALDTCIILSHRGNDARQAAGGGASSGSGSRRVLHFARAALILRNPLSTSRERKIAHESAKLALVGLIEGADSSDDSCEAICNHNKIPVRWVDAAAYRLCLGLNPTLFGRGDYANHLRSLIGQLDWPVPVTCRSLGDSLKAPPEDEWHNTISEAPAAQIRFATIHSVKGAQFPLVALVLPKNLQKDAQGTNVLDHWESGTNSEARRVLYVGASRAEKVLVLALHRLHAARVAAIFQRDHVPFTTLDEVISSS